MQLVRLLVLLSTCFNVVKCFLMHGRYLTPSRRSALFEKALGSKREKPTNNIFTTYVQNRVPVQPSLPIESEPMLPMVEKIAQVADMRKATSVVALRVSHLTEITQFMVLVEASNSRQIQAIADTVEEDVLVQCGVAPHVKEGTAASGWRVLDYGGVLLHVMSPAMRGFYKLEKRWVNAERVDLSHVLQQAPPTAQHLQDQRTSAGRINAGSSTPSSAYNDAYGDDGDWATDSYSEGSNDAGVGAGAEGTDISYYDRFAEDAQDPSTGLSAEDVAFWGEEELIQQMQERRRGPRSVSLTAPPAGAGNSAVVDAGAGANGSQEKAKAPVKRRLGSKRVSAAASSSDSSTTSSEAAVEGTNDETVVAAAPAVKVRATRKKKTTSTTAEDSSDGVRVSSVASSRKNKSKVVDIGRVDDAGAGESAASEMVDSDAADCSTSSMSGSILDEFY